MAECARAFPPYHRRLRAELTIFLSAKRRGRVNETVGSWDAR